jgi:hypothetical protein
MPQGLAETWIAEMYGGILRGMDRATHWDAAFAAGDEQRSWYQGRPSESLRPIEHVVPIGMQRSLMSGAAPRGFRVRSWPPDTEI